MRRYEATIHYHLIEEGPAQMLSNLAKVVEYMKNAFDELQLSEQFWVILLDRRNHPMGRHRISVGRATSTLAHPREVFRAAVLGSAACCILTHNHPSGIPKPSAADIQLTRTMREAGKILDIQVLDHAIIGSDIDDPMGRGYHFFREAGLFCQSVHGCPATRT
jgi:DNA repair protein RadC